MTESVLLDDSETVLAILRRLKDLGARLPSTTSAPATPPSATGIAPRSTSSRSTGRSAQLLALRRMGCDVGQGHYFGRPMEAGDMDRLVGDERTAARGGSAPR